MEDQTTQSTPSKAETLQILRSGVIFEENFIEVIAEDIGHMREFSDIDDTKRKQIIQLLTVLEQDSAKHMRYLARIVEHFDHD